MVRRKQKLSNFFLVQAQAHLPMRIDKVRLAGRPVDSLWDVDLEDGVVNSVTPAGHAQPGEQYSLLLPALCHPHIHLDKAFLLISNDGRYDDLAPTEGTFQEALTNTSAAKSRYDAADLALRGSQLITESVQAGVTSMRAFVEVDHVVGTKCVDAALKLRKRFYGGCEVQICAFAQDPIFSGPHGAQNRMLLEKVLEENDTIHVLGTTPYVEDSPLNTMKNIRWAVGTAMKYNRHIDFHLDYNLDPTKPAYLPALLSVLKDAGWKEEDERRRTVCVGHCTRMTLFSEEELNFQAAESTGLPISFIGLPTSDMYMMGRSNSESRWNSQRPLGTLQIPNLVKNFGMNAALGINNVGNAFTPYGSVDPLQLACIGVGLYHAGTEKDAELLYECISIRARRAIGLETAVSLTAEEGQGGEWILFSSGIESQMSIPQLGSSIADRVPPRTRKSVQQIVWDPPSCERRMLVDRLRGGKKE